MLTRRTFMVFLLAACQPAAFLSPAHAQNGNGNGNGGGNGGGNGKSGSSGNAGNAGGKKSTVATPDSDQIAVEGSSIAVSHADGTRETIRDGFYEMTDAKGRRIIRRRAIRADLARLDAMLR